MTESNLRAGRETERTFFRLDESLVRDYIAATDDQSQLYQSSNLVPPTAVAALGVRTIMANLSLPPGMVHLAQELASHSAAAVGQTVSCRAKVAQSSQRRDGMVLVLEFTVADEQDQPVLDGRTTLMIPGQKE